MAFFDGYLIPFVDSAVMTQIQQSPKKVDFGQQRVFGAIGYSIGAFVTTLVAKSFPDTSNLSPYSAAYFVYSVVTVSLIVPGTLLLRKANLKQPRAEKPRVFKVLVKTLINFHVLFFLLTALIIGIILGLHLSFVLMLMRELNSPTVLMGLTFTLGGVGSILLFPFTTKLIEILGGTMPTIALAGLSYVVRFMIYSYATTPYMIFAIQVRIKYLFSSSLYFVIKYAYYQMRSIWLFSFVKILIKFQSN